MLFKVQKFHLQEPSIALKGYLQAPYTYRSPLKFSKDLRVKLKRDFQKNKLDLFIPKISKLKYHNVKEKM